MSKRAVNPSRVDRQALLFEKMKAIKQIPPIPLFAYANKPERNGTVFRYLFPANGMLHRVCLLVETVPEDVKSIPFTIVVEKGNMFHREVFYVTRKLTISEVSISVEAGTRGTIKTTQAGVGRIWTSGVYEVSSEEAITKRVMLKELEHEGE